MKTLGGLGPGGLLHRPYLRIYGDITSNIGESNGTHHGK